MNSISPTPPIIILGMHRSGTSLVAGILKNLGLFIGDEVQGDNEAVFFLNINDALLNAVGESWDKIDNIPINWQDEKSKLLDYIRTQLESKKFKHYSSKPISSISYPVWGWKDPRNTLTYDLWSDIYPNAKYIHVYRNPIDVAQSLKVRYLRNADFIKIWKRRFKKLPKLMNFIGRERRVSNSDDPSKFLDIDNGVNLWKQYVREALRVKNIIQDDMWIDIKYEDFLSSPSKMVLELSKFIGLNVNMASINEATSIINPKRKYAFTDNKELMNKYVRYQDDSILKLLGYSKLNELMQSDDE